MFPHWQWYLYQCMILCHYNLWCLISHVRHGFIQAVNHSPWILFWYKRWCYRGCRYTCIQWALPYHWCIFVIGGLRWQCHAMHTLIQDISGQLGYIDPTMEVGLTTQWFIHYHNTMWKEGQVRMFVMWCDILDAKFNFILLMRENCDINSELARENDQKITWCVYMVHRVKQMEVSNFH